MPNLALLLNLQEHESINLTDRSSTPEVSVETSTPSDLHRVTKTQKRSRTPSDSNPQAGKRLRYLSHVQIQEDSLPRSRYGGWVPPLPESREWEAVDDLKAAWNKNVHLNVRRDYIFLQLDSFVIYRPPLNNHQRHAQSMATLDRLQNRAGCNELMFDGVLSFGEERRYVSGVQFSTLTIEGYGDPDSLSVREHVCIQSQCAKSANVWYQMGEPAPEYRRYFTPFMWLAQFTKHFVDYMLETESVTIKHFQKDFLLWLKKRLRARLKWLDEAGLSDFRTTVAAHVGFLWKECQSIDHEKTGPKTNPLWKEIDPQQLAAIVSWPNVERLTVVTPLVYESFNHMYFAPYLTPRTIDATQLLGKLGERKAELGLTPFWTGWETTTIPGTIWMGTLGDRQTDLTRVRRGDVVCLHPDDVGPWDTTRDVWYAFVQHVHPCKTKIDILWLYEPVDTTIGKAKYRFANELFLSDNCSCGKEAVDVSNIVGKIHVNWFSKDPFLEKSWFVRQKFRTIHEDDTYDFVKLRPSDFRCSCRKPASQFDDCVRDFNIDDCVLVWEKNATSGKISLEPAILIDFDKQRQEIHVQILTRKETIDGHASPNELIPIGRHTIKRAKHIIRKCHMRYFDARHIEQNQVPSPWNRGGSGDFWYIDRSSIDSFRSDAHFALPKDVHSKPAKHQSRPKPKLKGMGIFCGGGNFDRGLEEGGAINFDFAIDWDAEALHSYRANSKNNHAQYFCGSVNDYLAQALGREPLPGIAQPGDVDLLAAGSPCPGFSALNNRKGSTKSLQDASMVASVMSFVDFYSPQYLVLENVVEMTQLMGPNKDENVFSQILATLVALGYQVQQFLMDAWSFGSSQSRSRVFIVATIPGTPAISPPPLTHSHPHWVTSRLRSLGKSANGRPFGSRRVEDTPFTYITASQSVSDLPYLGDCEPQICPSHPDHRVPTDESYDSRARIRAVPLFPEGMGLVQAVNQGLVRGPILQHIRDIKSHVRTRPGSRMYSRVKPQRLFPTVTTIQQPTCGIAGQVLRWDEHRLLTVLELRRAQGFLDHEVIVGTARGQAKIVGNSVDRRVALALGLVVKESWEKFVPRPKDDDSDEAFCQYDYTDDYYQVGELESDEDYESGADLPLGQTIDDHDEVMEEF